MSNAYWHLTPCDAHTYGYQLNLGANVARASKPGGPCVNEAIVGATLGPFPTAMLRVFLTDTTDDRPSDAHGISPRLRTTVDERERAHLIEKLEQYSGAPIPVPEGDAEIVKLPKPSLERDDDILGTVHLRFDVRGAPDYWVDLFNREAGGPGWPPGLPIPTLDDDRIEIARLHVDDVRRYVDALREYFAFTNLQAERRRPEVEARRQESESAAHRFDEEFKRAQRFLDREFGPSGD